MKTNIRNMAKEMTINKIIEEFKLIESPTMIDYLNKSQQISNIIYKDGKVNKETKRLINKYKSHLADIDIKDEYYNLKKK
jgi:hypothetical protein